MNKFKRFAMGLLRDDRGLSLVKYALGGALISIAAAATLVLVGTGVDGAMGDIQDCLNNAVCP